MDDNIAMCTSDFSLPRASTDDGSWFPVMYNYMSLSLGETCYPLLTQLHMLANCKYAKPLF